MRGTELVSIDVFGPRLDLPPILLSAACSLRLGLLLHIPKRHLPPVEDSCQGHVGTRCTAVVVFRCFGLVHSDAVLFENFSVNASEPSCVIL